MIVLKKSRLLIIAVIVLLSAFVIADCVKFCLSNSPSYTVINRWYDNDDKRINLNDYTVEKDITLHTTVTASQFVNPKLIIKAKNLNIMARTNGRIILDNRNNFMSGLGSHYYFIDANDLDDGIVYLHLSPEKFLKSKVQGTVYLTTQNDFMFNRVVHKIPLLIIMLAVIHSLALLLLHRKNKPL